MAKPKKQTGTPVSGTTDQSAGKPLNLVAGQIRGQRSSLGDPFGLDRFNALAERSRLRKALALQTPPTVSEPAEILVANFIERLKKHLGTLDDPEQRDVLMGDVLTRLLDLRAEFSSLPQPLPDTAPELWAEREGRKENPVAFIRRVYAPWLGRGLKRPDISRLDPPLYNALNVWCHRNPDDTLPELITLSQHIDKMVEDLSDRYSEEELRKLGLALQMRTRKR